MSQRILDGMALDIVAVQAALAEDGLDGWLLYDFHGSNPIARSLVGLNGGGKMTTRRWYYLIPASGEPRALVHAIEPHTLDGLPGRVDVYASRDALARGLDGLTRGLKRVAMEYSPGSAIPYVGRVDAGTVEPSGSAGWTWSRRAIWCSGSRPYGRTTGSRRTWPRRPHSIGSRTARSRPCDAGSPRRRPTTEYEVQQVMVGWFRDEGLTSDGPPVVASRQNAGNPHYMPAAAGSRSIRARRARPAGPVGQADDRRRRLRRHHLGRLHGNARARRVRGGLRRHCRAPATLPSRSSRTRHARRPGRARLARSIAPHARSWSRRLRGPRPPPHRPQPREKSTATARTWTTTRPTTTGGCCPGTGFTVEPGLYFDRFGVRTEINVYFGRGDARVSGPSQGAIVALG